MDNSIKLLYNLLKPLAKQIPIYKEVMVEDENSTPESYILLVSDLTNTAMIHGDGKTIIRESNCDIHLISKGTAQNDTCKHNLNRVKISNLLEKEDVDYIGVNLGFNETHKYTEYVWSISIRYGKS